MCVCMEYSNNRIIQIKKLDNNLNKIKLKYTITKKKLCILCVPKI